MSTKKRYLVPIPAKEEFASLGQRLRDTRKARTWTLEDMARKCHCSVPTLRSLEQGHCGVSAAVLLNVLWCLGEHHSLREVCKEVIPPAMVRANNAWKNV